MNSRVKSVVFSVALVALFAVTSLAFAQPSVDIPGVGQSPVSDAHGLLYIVKKGIGWAYTIFFILAVLFVLMAAFTYLGAAGEEEKLKKAKNQLIYAAVAVVVALLAIGFSQIVGSFITQGVPTS